MGLIDLDIKREYRSFNNSITKDFYIPILKESIIYRRAVGFFSSSSLAEIGQGISELIKNGGRLELIASPKLSEMDIKAIELGYKMKEQVIEECLFRELKSPTGVLESERLNYLAYLIANGKLDIKIALLKSKNKIGIYHEKLGIVEDKNCNKIAFTGSLNETANAMLVNYESIDVFTSWNDNERVCDKILAFESIWSDKEAGLEVMEFPKVKKEIIERYQKEKLDLMLEEFESESPKDNIEIICESKTPYIPSKVKLYDYQLEAINNWSKSNYKGIFDMATGTGKTYTGIAAIIELFGKNERSISCCNIMSIYPFSKSMG